ncbi:hypothetical protein JQ574_22865 [Bradyrhizobium sp. AUGA SZCCT0158]|uniref:hypothetical protein n=1 Tax=Bradyrhizobium sp. AUGA SZCCT0158 TaxID=2807661 RepID=UPI001BAA919B|nr:hypothetical protein [Bradyrhizobium sp. AUGA SZCCT0158]MBR1198843.1 hypothetical protein [Bradyrhizobium sp. AUGA SZCCT0158]
MSWEAVTWANKQKLKKSYEQIVLLVLANCADPNGEAFVKWPGREHWWVYLSDRTRLPKSSLFRHLNTLMGLGLGERAMQVLADGSRRPTFKLNMNVSFDIDLPEDEERYNAIFAKGSAENQSPVGTEHDDLGEGGENGNDISGSQASETTIAPQSPAETGETDAPVPSAETGSFPVLRLHKDSKPFSKDSPLPPSGGAAGPGFAEFQKVWLRPIERPSVAQRVWDHIPTEKLGEAIAAAKGYFEWIGRQRKEPAIVSAQTFLREVSGWSQWLAYAPTEAGTPVVSNTFAASSREGRAIAMLWEIAGQGDFFRSVKCRGGAVFYANPITPRLLALADAPPRAEWARLGRQQAAAWEGLIGEGVQVARRRLSEGAQAPWPWPPRKDGTLSPAADGPVMTDDDIDALASEGHR